MRNYQLAIFILVFVLLEKTSEVSLDKTRSVYSIPYIRSFRQDSAPKSYGCDFHVAYSSFTHPQGLRDMANMYNNPYAYGSFMSCQPKQVYLKIFGYAQDYGLLNNGIEVANNLKRQSSKFRNIIVDWKQNSGDLKRGIQFLENFLRELSMAGSNVYLKVPASYLCRQLQGKPYILSLANAKKVIVEMYGQQPSAYKTFSQMFTSQSNSQQSGTEYPNASCPKYPSYKQLSQNYPNIQFYIEKTLQQEEPGYLGNEFQKMLDQAAGVYSNRLVFYDAFPPNIIPL